MPAAISAVMMNGGTAIVVMAPFAVTRRTSLPPASPTTRDHRAGSLRSTGANRGFRGRARADLRRHSGANSNRQNQREAFLWSQRRKVTKTATVSLHGNTYQVDPLLAGAHVDLLFDPFNMLTIEVRHDGLPAGTAVPFAVTRHAHPKARPEIPQLPPTPTGIDYAATLDAAHDTALARAVLSYADIDTTHTDPITTAGPDADPDTDPPSDAHTAELESS
jgi:hypothetical protein